MEPNRSFCINCKIFLLRLYQELSGSLEVRNTLRFGLTKVLRSQNHLVAVTLSDF